MKRNTLYSILKSSCDLHKTAPKVVYYAVIDGRQAGPFNISELKLLVKNGTLTSETLVWTPGLSQWVNATEISEVDKLLFLYLKPSGNKKQESVKTEHPLRKDLISALSELGYKQTTFVGIIDRILQDAPEISESDAIKEALKQLSSH